MAFTERTDLTPPLVSRLVSMSVAVGYVSCQLCGDPWLLREVASRSAGLCNDCWLEHGDTMTVRPAPGVEVELKQTGKKKTKKKKLTPERKQRIKLRDRARARALRKLALAFPVEFSELLAVERGRLGLDPWTVDQVLRSQLLEARKNRNQDEC